MISEHKRPIEILLVEDNPADVLLTKEAFTDAQIVNHLHSIGDGQSAMLYLHKHGKYANAPRPDIILLDLNLPVKNGREVLAELKADSNLRRIPVVVLSTSSHERDILSAYDLNANCYIVKPMDFDEFCKVVRTIESFWFRTATLPSR